MFGFRFTFRLSLNLRLRIRFRLRFRLRFLQLIKFEYGVVQIRVNIYSVKPC